ncbi:MAG TPA: MerR family transcriptional regulator [Kofleriaceae bacterium]|nr:MerR family transcriptional regulator [Kofleriaceae bacterium]
MFTVGEMSKLTGVTVRALHHYDEIGLVRPSSRTAAGYRLYGEADVRRLHDVLVFRELGVPLDDIATVIADDRTRTDALVKQRAVLVEKRERLDMMIAAVDRMTKGTPMTPEDMKSMFDGFDHAQYEAEAEQRWGHTDAFRESKKRTQRYGKAEWEEIKREGDAIYRKLVELMGTPVADPAVQAAVDEHRAHITRWFYPCSREIHRGLGEMYVADPRFTANLDAYAAGFAQFLRDAFCA